MEINYQELIDKAMHSVIRSSLDHIATYHNQSIGADSFLISFVTNYPGVVLSKHLKKRYPDEMIIVLQYQFEGLATFEDRFDITLYFDGAPELITIPYSSITSYIDKRASFALNFQVSSEQESHEGQKEVKSSLDQEKSNVIFLDQFRK